MRGAGAGPGFDAGARRAALVALGEPAASALGDGAAGFGDAAAASASDASGCVGPADLPDERAADLPEALADALGGAARRAALAWVGAASPGVAAASASAMDFVRAARAPSPCRCSISASKPVSFETTR